MAMSIRFIAHFIEVSGGARREQGCVADVNNKMGAYVNRNAMAMSSGAMLLYARENINLRLLAIALRAKVSAA